MEHPHNLLQLVVKQHYTHRPEVLERANTMLQEYTDGKTSYEQTLSNLYQQLNDLPSDIILYYLSTVPLPVNQEVVKTTSVLPGLMKQMLIPSYHNGMRPILLKYLNEKVPPLVPLTPDTNETENSEIDKTQNSSVSQSSEDISENKENVKSVIDENIKQDKNKNKKTAKSKTKTYTAYTTRNSNVKPLSLICANNVYKNHHSYFSIYKKQKREAWRLVNSNNCDKKQLDICYNVIRDTNKKIKWLSMIKTGQVSKDIIEEEYGKSDVFYLERHLQNTVSEDVLDLDNDMLDSINIFMRKC